MELIAKNSKNLGIIKPLAIGDDIRKWQIKQKNNYILYLYHGIDVTGLDAILHHLKSYKQQLENRATYQEWYELQQPQERYIPAFGQSKIIYPEIAKESIFTLDLQGLYPNNKAFVIPSNDLYLLGVLNSKLVWEYRDILTNGSSGMIIANKCEKERK